MHLAIPVTDRACQRLRRVMRAGVGGKRVVNDTDAALPVDDNIEDNRFALSRRLAPRAI